jgi:hypothetical protein
VNQPTPPTQITADGFRELLAKVNAPAEFVEEELERWRARGLIAPDPVPPALAEIELEKVLEKCLFLDYSNKIPYSNGFRAGFNRAQELLQKNMVAWLLYTAAKAKQACQEEEAKPQMGEVFWRRYWSGYFTALETAAKEIGSGDYRLEDLSLSKLETTIADTMASGNDITPYEIAVAIRDRFPNLLDELTT